MYQAAFAGALDFQAGKSVINILTALPCRLQSASALPTLCKQSGRFLENASENTKAVKQIKKTVLRLIKRLFSWDLKDPL